MSESLKDLRLMSDEQLIEKHDELARHTQVGTQHYLNELSRRDSDRATRSMVRLTWAITIMTIVVMLATIANVLVFIYR